MKKQTGTILAVLLAAGGAYLGVRLIASRRERMRDAAERWHVITVNKPFMEITNLPELPEPLDTISKIAAVDMRPTPDMSCTEIALRLHDDYEHSSAALRKVRAALRKTQMLLETGEIIMPDAGRSAEPTILNAPLRYITKFRYGEGRL